MNKILSAAAMTAGLLMASPAMAADMGTGGSMMTDPGFDWDGLYAGLKGEYAASTAIVDIGGIAFVLGANGTVDNILFGAEAWVGGFTSTGPTGAYLGASARIGYLATPDVVLYGMASVEHFIPAGGLTMFGVGGGVEFALMDNVSLDANYTYYPWTSTGPGANMHNLSASLNYHF